MRSLISYSCFPGFICRSWNVYLHTIEKGFILWLDWLYDLIDSKLKYFSMFVLSEYCRNKFVGEKPGRAKWIREYKA
jgi:hypothetical protein